MPPEKTERTVKQIWNAGRRVGGFLESPGILGLNPPGCVVGVRVILLLGEEDVVLAIAVAALVAELL